MTLASPSTGKEAQERSIITWKAGEPAPRDEFFWLSQINKGTMIINSREGLLDPKLAPGYARGLKKVIADASASGSCRPRMYVRYEPLLVKACGIEVTAMHAGRSSQDMHATFQRAILRDLAVRFAKNLNAARRALFKIALENRETIAPCYTNGVAAQPSSLGHTWLGHLAGFARDFEVFRGAWGRMNLCPMGTTVLNGTSWPLNRRAMAAYLGFDAPIANAYDAGQIAATDVALESALMLVSPLMHAVQFIQDIMVQYAQPRPWILVSATYASSAMPQKRNPGSLIDVRRDANGVLGALQSVLWRAHGLTPGMYDAKDVELNGEILRDAGTVAAEFARVLPLLKVDAKRALEELSLDWTASQELADILMRRFGIPFRLGHHVASQMVTVARSKGYTPIDFPHGEICRIYREVTAEEPAGGIPADFPMSESEFRDALDPRAIVANRATEGGPQEKELSRLFAETEAAIAADEAWLAEKEKQLSDAEAKLEADFEELASRL